MNGNAYLCRPRNAVLIFEKASKKVEENKNFFLVK